MEAVVGIDMRSADEVVADDTGPGLMLVVTSVAMVT